MVESPKKKASGGTRQALTNRFETATQTPTTYFVQATDIVTVARRNYIATVRTVRTVHTARWRRPYPAVCFLDPVLPFVLAAPSSGLESPPLCPFSTVVGPLVVQCSFFLSVTQGWVWEALSWRGNQEQRPPPQHGTKQIFGELNALKKIPSKARRAIHAMHAILRLRVYGVQRC